MFPAIKRAQFWAQSLWSPSEWAPIGGPGLALVPSNAVAMHQGRPGRARGLCAGPSGIEVVATSFKLST